ncbi:MAG: methionyl-tRNA formyltransferase [Spirochaetia bacterium]
MRIFFAGTPEIAVPSLEALQGEHEIVGVLTNPDSKKGRGRKLSASPVKQAALVNNLAVFQPERLHKEFYKTVEDLKPELLVVVAYGKIFRQSFLDLFPNGGVNLHPSLLPKYRGPSPIPAAILHEDEETGITVQKLSRKMDAGDIIIQRPFKLSGDETTGELTKTFAIIGAELMVEAVKHIEADIADPIPQDETQATYCHFIHKEDAKIDWRKPAHQIEAMVRAYDPWPGAFTYYHDKKLFIRNSQVYQNSVDKSDTQIGKVLGIDKDHGILVQTGEGVLCIQRLQLQSKNAQDYTVFINGMHGFAGSRLGGNE